MKSLRIAILCGLAAACGDKEKPSHADDVDGLTIALDAPAITVLPGASQTTTVQITRTGSLAGGSAALSATGAPAGVTVTFDTATTTADSATITIIADAGAAATTASVIISAVENDVSATATLSLTVGAPAPFTVHGTLVNVNGTVVPPTELSIWSHGAADALHVETFDDGTFSVDNVTAPYDVSWTGDHNTVLVLGLTRADPILTSVDDGRQQQIDTTYAVTFSTPHDASVYHALAIDCGASYGTALDTANPLTVTQMFGKRGNGSDCNVQALEFSQKADGFPTKYGYGSGTIANNVSATATVNITSYTGTGTSVTLTATGFDGGPVDTLAQSFVASEHNFITVGAGADADVAAPVAMAMPPTGTPIVMTVTAIASSGTASSIATKRMNNDTAQSIQTPPPPSITSPTNGQNNVSYATAFSVNAGTNASYLFELQYGADRLIVATASSSFTGDVLQAHGLSLGDGLTYTYTVTIFDNVPTIDAWATGVGTEPWVYGSDAVSLRHVSQQFKVSF